MQVSEISKELAKFARLDGMVDDHDADAVMANLARMMMTKARTPSDVLALVATARTILNANVGDPDTQEGYGQHCALRLIFNAVGALEAITGERAAVYTGIEHH